MVMLTFSILLWKYPFWANLIQNNQNYQFKMKFGTEHNLGMRNLIVMFIFSVLNRKHPFWVNLVIQIYLFKVKFGTESHSNMPILKMIFIFFILDRKYPFWKNWSRIIKAVTSVCLTCLTLSRPVFALTN